MADEAVLRIVIQDGGGGSTPGGNATSPYSASYSTPTRSQRTTSAAPGAPPSSASGITPPNTSQGNLAPIKMSDFANLEDYIQAMAQRKLLMEKINQAITVSYQNLIPPELPDIDLSPSRAERIAKAAQDQLDSILEIQEIRAKFNELAPMAEVIFDPAALAQEQFDDLKKTLQVKAKLAELVATLPKEPEAVIPVDLDAKLRRRYNEEQNRKEEEAVYQEKYGEPEQPPSFLSGLLKLGRMIHPAVRGHPGRVFGGVLGVGSAVESSTTAAASGASGTSGAAAGAGGALAAAAGPIGVAVAAVVALGTALVILRSQAEAAAQKLGEYSATISQAQATAEVRETMGNLRRAQESGPAIATYIDTTSKIEQQAQDIQNEILKQMLEAINPLLKLVEQLMPVVALLTEVALYTSSLVQILRLVGKLTEDLGNQNPVNDPTDVLLNIWGGQAGRNGNSARTGEQIPLGEGGA